jgi:transcriptional regulator with XRE-family HTH domain
VNDLKSNPISLEHGDEFMAGPWRSLMNKSSLNRIDKYVGSRIRVRRHTLGISQRKLAHALGLTFQRIQRYENGTDRIAAGRLRQLSQVLQTPAAFFFQGAPNISVGSREPKIESPVRLMRFLSTREGTALGRVDKIIDA